MGSGTSSIKLSCLLKPLGSEDLLEGLQQFVGAVLLLENGHLHGLHHAQSRSGDPLNEAQPKRPKLGLLFLAHRLLLGNPGSNSKSILGESGRLTIESGDPKLPLSALANLIIMSEVGPAQQLQQSRHGLLTRRRRSAWAWPVGPGAVAPLPVRKCKASPHWRTQLFCSLEPFS